MAFLCRLGNFLRHAANSSEMRTSPSFFQARRSIMLPQSAPSTKLFVGGLSYSTDDESFNEAFSKYGCILIAKVILDFNTGRSRGFGIVIYDKVEEASRALDQALNGQVLDGRRIRINYTKDRPRFLNCPHNVHHLNSRLVDVPFVGNIPGGGYGGGSYGTGGKYGDAAGNDYSSPDNFGTSSYGGSYRGSGIYYGNGGNFTSGGGKFGDVGSHDTSAGFAIGSNAGFTSSVFDGNALDGSGGTGIGSNSGGGHNGSGGLEHNMLRA